MPNPAVARYTATLPSSQAEMRAMLSRIPEGLSFVPKEALYSLILGACLLILASVGSWLVAHRQTLEAQRFWRLTFRNIAAVGFLLGASIIWRGHLQPVMVALSATTAGILIAVREVFLSLLASGCALSSNITGSATLSKSTAFAARWSMSRGSTRCWPKQGQARTP